MPGVKTTFLSDSFHGFCMSWLDSILGHWQVFLLVRVFEECLLANATVNRDQSKGERLSVREIGCSSVASRGPVTYCLALETNGLVLFVCLFCVCVCVCPGWCVCVRVCVCV